jgi:uncharacterized protein
VNEMLRMVFAAVALFATTVSAFGQMTVIGTGTVSATPDTAYISLAVESTAPTANVALDNNTSNMKKLMKTLNDLGIPKKDIHTGSFNVYPRYGKADDKTGEPPFLGYEVNNEITVTVCQIDQMGKVLDQSVKNGANRINGLHFGFSNQTKLQDDARKRAVEDAKRKAELLASTAGARLTSVVSITEEGGYRPRVYGLMQDARRITPGGDVPISPGEQTLTINVTIVWKLADSGR